MNKYMLKIKKIWNANKNYSYEDAIEYRCPVCDKKENCPAYNTGVCYPCPYFTNMDFRTPDYVLVNHRIPVLALVSSIFTLILLFFPLINGDIFELIFMVVFALSLSTFVLALFEIFDW